VPLEAGTGYSTLRSNIQILINNWRMIPVAGRAAVINAAFTEASQARPGRQASGGPGYATSACILVGLIRLLTVVAIAVARRHPRPRPATCPGVELGTGEREAHLREGERSPSGK